MCCRWIFCESCIEKNKQHKEEKEENETKLLEIWWIFLLKNWDGKKKQSGLCFEFYFLPRGEYHIIGRQFLFIFSICFRNWNTNFTLTQFFFYVISKWKKKKNVFLSFLRRSVTRQNIKRMTKTQGTWKLNSNKQTKKLCFNNHELFFSSGLHADC